MGTRKYEKERNLTFSRALTSTTVLVSSAKRLSLIAFTSSGGVLGFEGLKNENDIFLFDYY